MFVVTVIKKNDFGSLVEVGIIEFHGVRVLQPGGGVRVPVQQGGDPVPLRSVLKPKDFLSEEVVKPMQPAPMVASEGR